MKQGDFTHFEIPADDPDRAKAFYSGLFDWSFADPIPGFDGYHLFTTPVGQEGMGGAIGKRGENAPEQLRTYVHVDSVDASLQKVTELGGTSRRGQGGGSRPGLVRHLPRHRGQRDRGLGVSAHGLAVDRRPSHRDPRILSPMTARAALMLTLLLAGCSAAPSTCGSPETSASARCHRVAIRIRGAVK